jgi:hypothetical protein
MVIKDMSMMAFWFPKPSMLLNKKNKNKKSQLCADSILF